MVDLIPHPAFQATFSLQEKDCGFATLDGHAGNDGNQHNHAEQNSAGSFQGMKDIGHGSTSVTENTAGLLSLLCKVLEIGAACALLS